MIQDIFPHYFNNQYEDRQCAEDDFIVVMEENKILLKENNGILQFPMYCELREECKKEKPVYLFKIDGHAYYSMDRACFFPLLQKTEIAAVRQFSDRVLAMAAITAVQLIRWRKSRKYCSVCGFGMEDSTTERARICPQCHHVEYPVISPCIIVAVIDKERGKLLIVRSFSNTVRYALVAGYVEIGETLEQTVSREVKEETGLDIKNIRYFGSQPWAFSSTQMMAYVAELDGDPALHIQESEIREAYWAAPQELEEMADPISIGHTMIELFRQGKLQ